MYVFSKFCLFYEKIIFISVVDDKKKFCKLKLFGIILKLRKTELSCIFQTSITYVWLYSVNKENEHVFSYLLTVRAGSVFILAR